MWYKNIRAQNFLILTLSFIGIAGAVYLFNLQWELSTDERKQIETAVFSSLIDYLTYHPQVEADYLFIGTSGNDPTADVLETFEGRVTSVEPISSSRKSFGFSAPVVHKTDVNKRGISIDMQEPEKQADGTVHVLISIYQDRASSANYRCILNKRDGAYRVKHITFPDQDIF